jgi:hypothetical protein
MNKPSKMPVIYGTLIRRINRRLKHTAPHQHVRGEPSSEYYLIDATANKVTKIDLVAFGRKLGVLHAWEQVQSR